MLYPLTRTDMKQIAEDIIFLLSFVPEVNPDKIPGDLPAMFYITGSYIGDLALAERARDIMQRHNIDEESLQEKPQ